jgi:histidinol dehydrogenase
MMKVYRYNELTEIEVQSLTHRPASNSAADMESVLTVIRDVELNGDEAVRRYTLQWDGILVEAPEVSAEEWAEGASNVSAEAWSALHKAARNIEAFHRQQIPMPIELETAPGVLCKREWRALQRVGLYVPGGTAPLVSTVLMLGIPARLAGCTEILLFSPPDNDGLIAPAILAASRVAGVHRIFRIGGSQAIAAMALGTETIPRVDKIFGPGNRFVTAAKAVVSRPPYNTGIDLIAGPSELLIIADETSDADWLAADLLTQTEHGSDSQVVLVSTSQKLITTIVEKLAERLELLPRKSVAEESLQHSFAIITENLSQAFHFANLYAPEHLMVSIQDAEKHTSEIQNAGSVFLGPLTTVVFGDYASGTNHTLPTNGTSRFSGGLTTESFMKPISFQSVTSEGIAPLVDTVRVLARMEGLEAHALAAEFRIVAATVSPPNPLSILKHCMRPGLRNFKPYTSARSELTQGSIYLDANELSLGSAVQKDNIPLNRYPDPIQSELRLSLAERLDVPADSVFTGNGSDEIIDLLVRLFCEPNKDEVAILEPTYGVYEVAAQVQSARVVKIGLDDRFQINLESVLECTGHSTHLLFCCSPNNPTGNLLNRESILELLTLLRNTIVVLDEAYIEFAQTSSLAKEAASFPNLVVLRTLSKAWGLAGIRLGYCVASSAIISALNKIKPPYNVNVLTMHAALSALKQRDFVDKTVQTIVSERIRVSDVIGTLPSVVYVYPSAANFLLVRFRDASAAFRRLLSEGIVVRRRSEKRLQDCLRITIGTPEENSKVLQVLSELA